MTQYIKSPAEKAAAFDAWLQAKAAKKKRKAEYRDNGPRPISDKTSALKGEMKTGFHAVCRNRDRVDQYLQALLNITRKLPPNAHADHIIPQAQASREQKTDPRYGIGCLALTNQQRFDGVFNAAMVKDGPHLWQVIWTQTEAWEVCKRRMMLDEDGATLWQGFERPVWMHDGNEYTTQGEV